MPISDIPLEECDATKAPYCTHADPQNLSFLPFYLQTKRLCKCFVTKNNDLITTMAKIAAGLESFKNKLQ
jgi:hypothetical protein